MITTLGKDDLPQHIFFRRSIDDRFFKDGNGRENT